MTIEELDLSVRTYNCLKRRGINFVDDLCRMTEDELFQIRNFGRSCLEDVKENLNEHGWSIREQKGVM
jgi:DNA-directed RNA polymerase subunit alpha